MMFRTRRLALMPLLLGLFLGLWTIMAAGRCDMGMGADPDGGVAQCCTSMEFTGLTGCCAACTAAAGHVPRALAAADADGPMMVRHASLPKGLTVRPEPRPPRAALIMLT
jgi:hypothetical protein